jgi:Family of unknown function (DUF5317)
MRNFLRVTMLWVMLLPLLVGFAGVASNQLVLIANHDKFPVMLNEHKNNMRDGDGNALVDADGMIDDAHCVMTSETHLNVMADIFDFKDAIYSVGDGLINLGAWGWTWAPFVWVGLVIRRLHE